MAVKPSLQWQSCPLVTLVTKGGETGKGGKDPRSSSFPIFVLSPMSDVCRAYVS